MMIDARRMKTKGRRLPKWLVPAALGIIALSYGIITYRQGRIESTDTGTYSDWADILISSDFNYLRMARSINFVVPSYLYLGWLTVVALFKITLGAAWPAGIVIFNYCLALAAIWATLDLIKRTTRSALSILVAGVLLLIAYELFNWIRFVLSDISFMAITFALYYLFCLPRAPTEKGPLNVRRYAACIALIIAALFYRPTGVPLVMVAGLAYLTRRMARNRSDAERAGIAMRIAGAFCLLAIAGIVMHSYFMKEPASWPLSFASKWIAFLSNEYRQGYIVMHRPATYVSVPISLPDYIFITLKKLVYFFAIYSDSFGLAHKAANLMFFIPAYFLAILAILNLFRGRCRLTAPEWWTTWIGFLWIFSFALYHSVQQIDYDWRYRLPCLLPLVVLSGIGLRSIASLNRVEGRRASVVSSQTPAE
jgi:hypothetical protein